MRLSYRDTGGDGPAVVLLHGLAGYGGEWAATVDALRDVARLVTVDLRGHGESTRRPADVSGRAYAADVAAIAGHLGLDRVVLVGQSFGGHTAMLAAGAYPDLVCRLVMVEAGVGGGGPGSVAGIERWLRSWPTPFPDRAAAVAFFGGSPGSARAWADGLAATPDGLRPRFDADVLLAALDPVAAQEHWSAWRAVRCPTLLVLGERGYIPPDQVEAMLAVRPDTDRLVVPDAGHDVHLDQPDAWHDIARRFIAVPPR